MHNHLAGHNNIKQTILCGDHGRINIDTKLIEGLGGKLLPGKPHTIGIRLYLHYIQAMGMEKTA